MSYIRRGNYCRIGNRAYSYDTCIMDVLPDGRTIGNVTKYSATTGRHQNEVGVCFCSILVDDVPKGTDNLAAWYAGQVDKK